MNTSAVRLSICVLLLALVAACHKAEGPNPARSDSHQSRAGELFVGEQAQAAIGLALAKVEQRDVARFMPATGWLAAPPGSEVVVKSPTTGFVIPVIGQDRSLGQLVNKAQHLANLEVLLSPQEQAQLISAKEDTEKELQQARSTLKLQEEQLQRAEAAGQTAVAGTRLLELREIVAHARAAEEAARKKLPFLPQGSYDDVHLKTVQVDAPVNGRLVNVHFAPRQLVVAGDPLWTIADWSNLWVRVPVYNADLPRINQSDPADVVVPGANDARRAKPLRIPQATETGKQTVELLYEVANDDGSLRPGQAVSVSLPTGAKEAAIVIPRSAVLWDGMGNSWVYVRAAADAFRRQKVETRLLIGDKVAIRRGLKKGDEVVSTGAEALYGEEFKGQIQVEDKD